MVCFMTLNMVNEPNDDFDIFEFYSSDIFRDLYYIFDTYTEDGNDPESEIYTTDDGIDIFRKELEEDINSIIYEYRDQILKKYKCYLYLDYSYVIYKKDDELIVVLNDDDENVESVIYNNLIASTKKYIESIKNFHYEVIKKKDIIINYNILIIHKNSPLLIIDNASNL